MKNNFTLMNAFKAEWLKIKGLGLLMLAVICGIIMPLTSFIVKIFFENSREYDGILINTSTNEISGGLSIFGGFFMLLFIIIAASRIGQIDHKNNGWTFLETQPISKLNIYSGKFLVIALLSFVMLIIYFSGTIIILNATLLVFPQKNLLSGVDLYWQFQTFLRLWILSLCIISFQLMISIIITGFVWPFVIGFIGFVINIVGTSRNETYDFIPFNNVQTGLSFNDSFSLNHFFNYTEYLSLFWTILFFVIGYLWYSRRGFRTAFFRSKKVAIFSILGILIFYGIYYLITKPVYPQKSMVNSSITGTIQSPKPVNNIQIISKELGEIVADIAVKNGSFKWKSKENIPFGEYYIVYDNKKYKFIFSKGDQITFNIKMDDKQSKVVLKGTRKAEDMFIHRENNDYKFYAYTVAQKLDANDPVKFYKDAREEWNIEMKVLNNFRTKENIYFASDFKEYEMQLNASTMLSALYDYQKMTSFTDQKFAPPKDFTNELNNVVKKPNSLLLTTDIYKNLRLKEMLPKEGTKNPDSILLVKINQMPPNAERDQLLSTQILKIINLETDEKRRNEFFAAKINGVQDSKYRNYLLQQLSIINNQQKGKPFPNIHFQDESGKTVSLSKFKGKFVVIDFWATWCGPCRETTPIFEYQAKKNKYNDNLVFISASIDEDKNKWKLDLKNKKSDVIQWWISDPNILQTLGVDGIPRFMMIDPDGKMYNANMPRPNDTNFEDILEKAGGKSFNFSVF